MDPSAFVYIALSGEQEFGLSSGIVIVDTANTSAKFTKLAEIQPEQFRNSICDELRRHPENLYIIHKTTEHMHVFTHNRERALAQMKSGELPFISQV